MTGNYLVDEISKIRLEGNIIPHSWYKTITMADGKPDTISILILADIVYWYTATEKRCEDDPRNVFYKKKFKSDKLQRSYAQLEDHFGFTKNQIRGALDRLENAGLIIKELRNYPKKKLFNCMFLAPVPAKIKEVTFSVIDEKKDFFDEDFEVIYETSDKSPASSQCGTVDHLCDTAQGVVYQNTEGSLLDNRGWSTGQQTNTYTSTENSKTKNSTEKQSVRIQEDINPKDPLAKDINLLNNITIEKVTNPDNKKTNTFSKINKESKSISNKKDNQALEVINYFRVKFGERYKREYLISNLPKEQSQINRVLKHYSLDKMKSLVDLLFKYEKDFVNEKYPALSLNLIYMDWSVNSLLGKKDLSVKASKEEKKVIYEREYKDWVLLLGDTTRDEFIAYKTEGGKFDYEWVYDISKDWEKEL